MLKGIERLLKAHGFDPELYDSAEAFYDHASPEEALCVVLDVHLGGMSGIDLKRRLADDGTSLPVIFITATDNDMVRRAAHDVGCRSEERRVGKGWKTRRWVAQHRKNAADTRPGV